MNAILITSLLTSLPALQEGAAPAAPAEPTVEISQERSTGSDSSEFGEPVYVNGRRISDLAIKRFLVYGPGRTSLESRRLRALMDQEVAIRESKGEDVSSLSLTEEEFQAAYEKEIAADRLADSLYR